MNKKVFIFILAVAVIAPRVTFADGLVFTPKPDAPVVEHQRPTGPEFDFDPDPPDQADPDHYEAPDHQFDHDAPDHDAPDHDAPDHDGPSHDSASRV